MVLKSTYNLLANIRVAFSYLDKELKKIITSIMCPKLEYAAVIWSTQENYKETGKDTKNSHKNGTKIERTKL